MESSTTRVAVYRVRRGCYRLDRGSAELRISGWRRRGEALVGTDLYVLRRTGVLRRGVAAFPAGEHEAALRLAPNATVIPPLTGCTWRLRARLRGHEATLRSEVGVITFRLGHGPRRGVAVEVSGEWPQVELVVLAGAYALLARRDDDADAVVATTAATVAAS